MQKELLKRTFVVGKQPKAIYQSQPYINFIDPNEKSFLNPPYVRHVTHTEYN